MGSGAFHEKMIASKWWETKAQKMLITTTIGKVEVICSLLPLEDGKFVVKLLKAGNSGCFRDNLYQTRKGEQIASS